MEHEKLLANPLPINRVAARVVKKAKPDELWRPMPKPVGNEHVQPGAVLRCAPIPATAQKELHAVIGARRGRLTVLGYAADQSDSKKNARWVVRCDCGNYEHRRHILRWLGTNDADMCRECRTRTYKLSGYVPSKDKATRATLHGEADDSHAP